MQAHLCTTCFPRGDDFEQYSSVPLGPCEVCGMLDDRWNGGPRVNWFPRDPRQAPIVVESTPDGQSTKWMRERFLRTA